MPNTRTPSCEDESNIGGLGYLKESRVSGGADEVRDGGRKNIRSWKNLEIVVMSLFCPKSL